ncbi:MAG: pyridoxine 5'-phosphate synthase [Bacteroidales bacterium]|nr:pyridoxine 5'-phosphate synthase [Bacteroidales bacterium]MBN2819397.1 pyridoxine 5'-phosphate synthase [Bacteroidales bacterium]
MTRLSVNINKIATLRNSRGGNIPNVLKAAADCQKFGAEGITVHPRPDERHIKKQDVYDIKPAITTEFNIEGYPSKQFIDLVCSVKPTQVTLVPDPPEAITSSAGWDTIKNQSFLTEVISEFHKNGIRTSIFTGTELPHFEAAAKTKTDRVELYTEPYATNYPVNKEFAIAPFIKAAREAQKVGLGINAGHDLSLENLRYFNENIPGLLEVSIGHALIADALYIGLEKTIKLYLAELT